MARILTIDDDRDALLLLRTILNYTGHEVLPLMRPDDLVSQVRDANPDLVITDIMMPGISGGSVYQLIRRDIGAHLPVIVSSSTSLKFKNPEDPLLAYSPKPVDPESLQALVVQLLAKAEGGAQNEGSTASGGPVDDEDFDPLPDSQDLS